MPNQYILTLIADWRAAKRAAASEDLKAWRIDYLRRADAYALAIKTNLRRLTAC